LQSSSIALPQTSRAMGRTSPAQVPHAPPAQDCIPARHIPREAEGAGVQRITVPLRFGTTALYET
jgi:hypothetical protein